MVQILHFNQVFVNHSQTLYIIKHSQWSECIQVSLVGLGETHVQEFGLSVSDQFEEVEAHVLEAPQLEYNTKWWVYISELSKALCESTTF
jgi:hypothetical protein